MEKACVSMVCCKCGSQISWCVNTNCKDGYRWRCRRITSPSARRSHTVHGFSRMILISEVLFLTYIVRSYEHDREHVVAREGLHQSLRPDLGINAYQRAHMFLAVCRFDNADHFAKFIGVVAKLNTTAAATIDWSTSSHPTPLQSRS
jgi:hypothetical protein